MLSKEPFVIIAENLIYEKDLLKSILQSDEYWRSFNYNLRDNQYMVDWTHEWEWNIMKFQLLSTWIMENQSIVLENFYRKLNPNFRCEHIHTERKQWRYT